MGSVQSTGAAGVLVEAGRDTPSTDLAALLERLAADRLTRLARLRLTAADATPAARATLKEQLRSWLHEHDIDALHFEAPPGFEPVVDELAAEALQIRAYLRLMSNLNLPAFGGPSGLNPASSSNTEWVLTPGLERTSAQAIALDLRDFTATQVTVNGLETPLTLDADHRIAWLIDDLPDTLRIITTHDTIHVPTRDWRPPYDYILGTDGTVRRQAPWVELRRAPGNTRSSVYEVLARTDSGAIARINDQPAHVYRTGVFFDSVHFSPGPNRLRLSADSPAGSRTYEVEIDYAPVAPRSPLPLWIEAKSPTPSENLELLPTDKVRLEFTGSLGQVAIAHVKPGGLRLPMSRVDEGDLSRYSVDLPARRLPVGQDLSIHFELQAAAGRGSIRKRAASTVRVLAGVDEFPLLRTTSSRCPLSYSLGRVRLGGPFRAEYGEGILLQASGRFGRYYRVRLSPTQEGFIHERYVEALPSSQVRPGYHITSLHARPQDPVDAPPYGADVVSIPWSEPVPYTIQADPEGRRLLVTLHGVKSTSTWIQQRSGMRYVERLAWEQIDTETYQVIVHLTTPMIWGYELQPRGKSLVLRLPYPPAPKPSAAPLSHLRIAIEAGHGGSNTGALGLSGLLEKDVNLDTALRLGDLCREAGADIVQLRSADEGIPYFDRIDSLEASGADLVISIHANSAGGGFLRASGTSTYFHNPFWAPFARRVYARMLELQYPEFGVVGSFNYRNIRLSSRPSILVEQAFMSHALDEEQLADPEHRQMIAAKILAGILDYLSDLQASEATLGPLPATAADQPPVSEGDEAAASTSSSGS